MKKTLWKKENTEEERDSFTASLSREEQEEMREKRGREYERDQTKLPVERGTGTKSSFSLVIHTNFLHVKWLSSVTECHHKFSRNGAGGFQEIREFGKGIWEKIWKSRI